MSDSSNSSDGSHIRSSYLPSHEEILDSFHDRWTEKGTAPFDTAVMEGQEPFRRGKLWSFFRDLGVTVAGIGNIALPDVLVLGREDVSKESVLQLLGQLRGERLRICSQEMVLAWAMTGVDPNERWRTAKTFVDGHPALEMVAEHVGERWPGTEPLSNSAGEISGDFGPAKSPLRRLGYKVGHSGVSKPKRRAALRKMFMLNQSDFPGNFSNEHLEEWGSSKSGLRLHKMANKLASSCRNARNRDADYDLAISHWEDDLAWLKEEFYNPLTYTFEWPSLH